MTYATLMVNLDPGQANAAVLGVAADLSARMHARVVGISVGQLVTSVYADGYVAGSLINQDRGDVERELGHAEADFHRAFHDRPDAVEWRSTVTFGSPASTVAAEARTADLVVTGIRSEAFRSLHTGDLVMEAGRPVLTVPPAAGKLDTDRIVVAWKDTREARRAVTDALPLLKLAGQVFVVEIASEDDTEDARLRGQDVVTWLGRHGVAAEATVSSPKAADGDRLHEVVAEHKAGLIVAGAYGHSRMREWMLGGVTRTLLATGEWCSLLSH